MTTQVGLGYATIHMNRKLLVEYDADLIDAAIDLEFDVAKRQFKQEVADARARRDAEHSQS